VSIRFHGSRGIHTGLGKLPDGSGFPVLIVKKSDDSGYLVNCGHGQSFTSCTRRRLPDAKLAACKAHQKAIEAVEVMDPHHG